MLKDKQQEVESFFISLQNNLEVNQVDNEEEVDNNSN